MRLESLLARWPVPSLLLSVRVASKCENPPRPCRQTIAFRLPRAWALDSLGNLYVADKGNHRVVKIAATDGVRTLVAGTGQPGSVKDGKLGTQAELCLPESVALDAVGNLYVADSSEQCSTADRPLGSNPKRSRALPTSATEARHRTLIFQCSVVSKSTVGAYTLADTGHHRIRAVDLDSGRISTFVGTGTPGFSGDGGRGDRARLFRPEFIALDDDGNLFIADTFNHRVRRVDRQSGVIETVAGTGHAGYNGDDKPAREASLFSPEGLAVDGPGQSVHR